MSDNRQAQYPSDKFRVVDGFVLVFFTFTAFLGLYLFRQDLMRTFEIRDEVPAGIITLRNNIVQRRHDDSVLWDRIFVNSYVYSGDLIRVAEVSSTNIDIAANEIFLNENTLIRIEGSMDGSGIFQVQLQQGNLSVSSGENSSGIALDLMGNKILTTAGAMLDVTSGEEGISLQVNDGKVEFIQEGQKESREITGGSTVAFDANGKELFLPSAIVKQPVQNARFLKDSREMYSVKFEWSILNVEEGDTTRLEISNDIDYKNIVSTIESLQNEARMAFDVGQWYWRLKHGSTVLRKGWFNIIDSSGPAAVSPVPDTLFRYHAGLPQMRLQWEKTEWASAYIIEISEKPDFSSAVIQKRINTNSFITSELGQGEWYWRVKPVFSSAFIGETTFSESASFLVEKTDDPKAKTIEISPAAAAKARAAMEEKRIPASGPVTMIVSTPVPAISGEQPSQPVKSPEEPARSAKGQLYTIRSGDTLGRLARQHYGDAMLWTIIVEANEIKNPDLIYPGQVFLIP